MSLMSSFAGAKKSFRRKVAAVGMATLATLFAANATQAASFTPQECAIVYETAKMTIEKTVGSQGLSADFKQSFRAFLGPKMACDGPPTITTRSGPDIDVFSVTASLLAHNHRIDLNAKGVRAVVPPYAMNAR